MAKPEPSQPAIPISHDLLTRLTSKPGVKSTLILSTTDGSILQATGRLALQPQTALNNDIDAPPPASPSQSQASGAKKERTVDDIAKAVFAFVEQAKVFADGMLGEGVVGEKGSDGEDVRLLRLRTRREEIVVYPEAKFLLLVVQDAPVS